MKPKAILLSSLLLTRIALSSGCHDATVQTAPQAIGEMSQFEQGTCVDGLCYFSPSRGLLGKRIVTLGATTFALTYQGHLLRIVDDTLVAAPTEGFADNLRPALTAIYPVPSKNAAWALGADVVAYFDGTIMRRMPSQLGWQPRRVHYTESGTALFTGMHDNTLAAAYFDGNALVTAPFDRPLSNLSDLASVGDQAWLLANTQERDGRARPGVFHFNGTSWHDVTPAAITDQGVQRLHKAETKMYIEARPAGATSPQRFFVWDSALAEFIPDAIGPGATATAELPPVLIADDCVISPNGDLKLHTYTFRYARCGGASPQARSELWVYAQGAWRVVLQAMASEQLFVDSNVGAGYRNALALADGTAIIAGRFWFDGSTATPLPDTFGRPNLYEFYGTSASDIWASDLTHWNGTSWQAITGLRVTSMWEDPRDGSAWMIASHGSSDITHKLFTQVGAQWVHVPAPQNIERARGGTAGLLASVKYSRTGELMQLGAEGWEPISLVLPEEVVGVEHVQPLPLRSFVSASDTAWIIARATVTAPAQSRTLVYRWQANAGVTRVGALPPATMKTYPSDGVLTRFNLVDDQAGHVWLAADGTMYELVDETFVERPLPLAPGTTRVPYLSSSPVLWQGQLFVSTDDHAKMRDGGYGVWHWNGTSWQNVLPGGAAILSLANDTLYANRCLVDCPTVSPYCSVRQFFAWRDGAFAPLAYDDRHLPFDRIFAINGATYVGDAIEPAIRERPRGTGYFAEVIDPAFFATTSEPPAEVPTNVTCVAPLP